MKKRSGRLLCGLLLGLLAVSLTGCGEKQAPEEPVHLTALQYELENQAIDFSDLWYYRQIEAQTGVHVDFEEVKDSDWIARVNLMFAGGSMDDMVLRGSLDVEEYGAARNLVLPLDAYLEKDMPVYSGRLNERLRNEIRSSDGKTYYVGFLLSQNIAADGHFFINQTWLDKLGLSVPQTVDELTEVLRHFRDDDPNGNGLRDEIPYQATFNDCNTGIYNAFSAWGVPLNLEMVYVDGHGKVHFAPEEDGFFDCVQWLNMLCRENLLDVACITQGSNLWGAKVNQNTAGYFSYWRLDNTALSQEIADQFVCMLPVHAEGRQARLGRLTDFVEFGAALTVQNRDPDASLRWLDCQMETENMLVAQNGPVGDMLRLREDGRYEVVYVPEANELYSIVPVICGQFFAPADYYESVYVPAQHREEKQNYSRLYDEAGVLEDVSYKVLTVIATQTEEEAAALQRLKTQLEETVKSSLVAFITKGADEADYQAMLKQLRAIGSEDYKRIYQQVYDRYLEGTGGGV